MAYIFDLSDAWAGGAAFTAIKMNVSDGGSTAGSLLMDLQVGGVSQFKVDKGGVLTGGGSTYFYQLGVGPNDSSIQFWQGGTAVGRIGFNDSVNNIVIAPYNDSATRITGPVAIGTAGGADTILLRDAANTLAQRNGVNAQAFNLYNTYTDASNYERGRMAWVSNTLTIGTQPAGTGTPRGISLDVGGTATRLDLGGGIITFINAALNLGGTTVAFPALKRSTTSMQVRLADDSAFTNIQGKLTTDTAYTAGAPTATGYIVLFDSTGTAYRVPAVAN